MVGPTRFDVRRISLRATAPGLSGFQGLAFFAARNDRRGTSGGDGVVALAGVEGTVGGDGGDLLLGWDLVRQFGPDVRQYLLREGLATDRVLLDPAREAMAHFETPGLPATLFFSSDGTLEDVHLGEISRAAFQSRLQSLR